MAKDGTSQTHTQVSVCTLLCICLCVIFVKNFFSSSVDSSPLLTWDWYYYKIIIFIIVECRLVYELVVKLLKAVSRYRVDAQKKSILSFRSSALRRSVDLTSSYNQTIVFFPNRYYRFGIAFRVPPPSSVPRCRLGCIHVEFTAQYIRRRSAVNRI